MNQSHLHEVYDHHTVFDLSHQIEPPCTNMLQNLESIEYYEHKS